MQSNDTSLLARLNLPPGHWCGTAFANRAMAKTQTLRGIGVPLNLLPYAPGEQVTINLDALTQDQQATVLDVYDNMVQPYVNLRFMYVTGVKADIMVSASTSNISYAGPIGARPAVIKYGTFDTGIVIHELMHCLGMHHEFQSPASGPLFNINATRAFYAKQGLTEQQINAYILTQLPRNNTNSRTRFDRNSVMLYTLPVQIMLGGIGLVMNTRLSALDKLWLASAYGPTPWNAVRGRYDSVTGEIKDG